MKILLVDDSEAVRELFSVSLQEMGHEVTAVADGEASLFYIVENEVDLVLMDVEMPRLSGFEATKAIRELRNDNWFPIIFLSSHEDDESFAKGIEAGGDAYLPKSLSRVRLRYTLLALERIYLMRRKLQETQRELAAANAELARLSLRDTLTGLGNRRQFDTSLAVQFELAKQEKIPLSLLISDVDHFKHYNDSLGHAQGDWCLMTVARVIREELHLSDDLVCRYGGEEFVVILPNTGLYQARAVADKIRLAVSAKGLLHGGEDPRVVSISVGVATFLGQYPNESTFFRAADAALYKAKQGGRNRVECG